MYSFWENLKKIINFTYAKTNAKLVITSILLILAFFISIKYFSNNPDSKAENEKVTILIEPGKSTPEIGDILTENKIITSKWKFILYSKILARNKKLIAGEYELQRGDSLKKIISIISKGESIVRKITIPEGYNVWQIANIINSEKRLAGQMPTEIQEGMLFPDTYYFRYGDLRSKIYHSMKEKMAAILESAAQKLNPNSEINTIEKLLILASIVEKEAGNDKEKPIIASVFINRLKKHMKLQADPTVIYAVTNGKSELNRPISKSDLAYDSPYNTYKIFGLPPAPISCPGLKSIEAVINPANTNYLYFVMDGNSGHNFSATLEEHNKYVSEYRKRSAKNVE